jgi:hypothetical protein
LLQIRDVARVALPFCYPSKSADDIERRVALLMTR